jgi:DNA-binding MarR family transcriptional regulator
VTQSRITFTLNHLVGELNKNADRILRDEFGLTYSQFLFLIHLQASGKVSSSTLARHMGVSRAAVSKRVSWFTSRGLIDSGQAPSDNRVLTLALTPRGKRLTTQMSDVLEERFREKFDSLTSVNLDELHQTLLQVHAHLQSREDSAVSR